MSTLPGSVTPQWLLLREPADGAARSERLAESVRAALPPDDLVVVHDIGSGSGSMGRWLAPRLPAPQRWILHDRDAALLDIAAAVPPQAPDGSPVLVETVAGDLAALDATGLANAHLVTCSALLDILTEDELAALVALCATVGRPALFTLSVTGQVRFTPADPFDEVLREAFNDHQRRTVAGRRPMGPDAPARACDLFLAHGCEVEPAASDWRLGPGHRRLAEEWLEGWVGAAVEQRPELDTAAEAYLGSRRSQLAGGTLDVIVGHVDLLARPRDEP